MSAEQLQYFEVRNKKRIYAVKVFLQTIGSRICLSLIKFYQFFISPLFPPTCRFTPTCSQYAVEAIKRYGVGHGLYLAVRRILRCHPFNSGGFDPVD